jgi:DNA uptake protein ComE-like DNA-binding protein
MASNTVGQPKYLALPDFVQAKVPIVDIGALPREGPGHFREPRYDHPEFQKAFRELVELLAAEYDHNPLIEWIDLMQYGFWGESHTGGLPSPFPDYATAERTMLAMTRLQIDAFRQAQLAVNTQPDISNVGNREVVDACVRSGAWLRSDSILVEEPEQIEALANTTPDLAAVVTPDLAAAIVDFRDPDDNPLPYGAESSYYLGLPHPYRAKNAPYESLMELLLVRGVTPAILFGEDRNLNGILDPNEDDGAASFPPDNADGVLDRGLYPFVTVSSASPLHPATGDWVNLNTDDISKITSVLGGKMSANGFARLRSIMYPRGRRGARANIANMGAIIRSVPAFATGTLKADLATIFKYSATSAAATAKGLINVNTAPLEVLETLPSVDENLATAIVAERDAGGHDFSTIVWLLDVPGITPQIFSNLVPLTSAQSALYTIDCVGTSTTGSAQSRIWVTVDASTPAMAVVSTEVRDYTGIALDFKAVQEAKWIGN